VKCRTYYEYNAANSYASFNSHNLQNKANTLNVTDEIIATVHLAITFTDRTRKAQAENCVYIIGFTLPTHALYSYNNIVHPYICFGRLPAILRGVKDFTIDYTSFIKVCTSS
jgi:hypothetical protein